MKLKFKHQKFQSDAAKAVCDVFTGQPFISAVNYKMDIGYIPQKSDEQQKLDFAKEEIIGFRNHPLVPAFNNNDTMLDRIAQIQRRHQIEPSKEAAGHYNLTIEMETGTGKTYTYIKTMYELYKNYGWTKYIVVVPSIAIREGVYKSFKITQEHFAEEYGKKIKFFIYNSARLNDIDQFASDSGLNVMIINSQAFNARGENARKIYMKLDSFRSRKPIDIIAATNPILIIDEPQSVEGKVTKDKLKEFNPLFTLRYSATPKEKYNLIYRLDAIEAYNKKLVKKIAVKGVTTAQTAAVSGYIYLQNIKLYPDRNPQAVMEFDYKGKTRIKKTVKTLSEGDNLYTLSNGLDEYKQGFTITKIDGRNNSVEFINGEKIYIGSCLGAVNEDLIRRLQIRETILSHIAKERKLFFKGIKVLSLFFIDEVAKYKQYDKDNNELNGIYADMFEEEYKNIINTLQLRLDEDAYINYLKGVTAKETHAGYFSIDKKSKKFINSKEDKKEGGSTDTDAYDLIMKNKERLLDLKEPVRFIFSHSALKEGWDNPNVFQICTLKQSSSEDRKRQEIGRGLRLCINQEGERMDITKLGETVHDINVLTVIANESYADFTSKLQSEIAQIAADRPRKVDENLFENKLVKDNDGVDLVIDKPLAREIYHTFIKNDYVDNNDTLTDKYYEDKKTGRVVLPGSLNGYETAVMEILDKIYDPNVFKPDNLNKAEYQMKLDEDKLNKKEFQELWRRINTKSAYVVNFDTDELIKKSISAINKKLDVTRLSAVIQQGSMDYIESKEALKTASAFEKAYTSREELNALDCPLKYDLIGKITEATQLTRKTAVKILQEINEDKFNMFKINPEDFIIKVSDLINEEKATVIIEHITYNKLDEKYSTDIFTEPELKAIPDKNVISAQKHLYNYLIYDSKIEKDMAEQLDRNEEVSVYVKLPKGFYINTPVGHYNPDWAIAFHEGKVKHIYFVAETKGSMQTLQLKAIEKAKINCAKEHFKTISSGSVKYDVVDDYQALLDKIMR